MSAQLKPFLWAGLGAAIAVGLMKAWPESKPEVEADPVQSTGKQVSSRSSSPSGGVSESGRVETAKTRVSSRETANTPRTEKEIFEELAAKFEAGEATDKEQLEFWEMVRSSEYFEEAMDELKEQVDGDPKDVENRLELAQMYVLKILTASAGPVKGIWGMKATKLWEEVLEVDSVNWKAQHSIAFSYSQYPEFLNKTDDSIEAYEKLLSFPQEGEPGKDQARAILELAKLYRKRGRAADAHSLLENGLGDHPDNEHLKKEFDSLGQQFVFDEEE